MSRKQRKHIRGKRGEAFLQIIRGVDRAWILIPPFYFIYL
jgi:hypothetical protein